MLLEEPKVEVGDAVEAAVGVARGRRQHDAVTRGRRRPDRRPRTPQGVRVLAVAPAASRGPSPGGDRRAAPAAAS
eukprot:631807-Pyramimonas_sp.AAC.1